jgi:hypothetical protein
MRSCPRNTIRVQASSRTPSCPRRRPCPRCPRRTASSPRRRRRRRLPSRTASSPRRRPHRRRRLPRRANGRDRPHRRLPRRVASHMLASFSLMPRHSPSLMPSQLQPLRTTQRASRSSPTSTPPTQASPASPASPSLSRPAYRLATEYTDNDREIAYPYCKQEKPKHPSLKEHVTMMIGWASEGSD